MRYTNKGHPEWECPHSSWVSSSIPGIFSVVFATLVPTLIVPSLGQTSVPYWLVQELEMGWRVHLSGHSYSGTPNSHPLDFLRFLLLTASAISVFGAFLEVYHIFCSSVYSHTLDLWFPSSILKSYLPGIYLVSYPLRCLLFFFFPS